MKGTQRKCLIASAVTHGLLLVMLFIGSAFLPQKRIEEPISITLVNIPDFLVDEPNMVGGGNPKAGIPEPQPAVQPSPQPSATPPVPQPEPPKPRPEPEPPAKQPVIPEPKVEAKPEPKAEVKPVEPKFDFSEMKKLAPKPETQSQTRPEPSFDLSKARRTTIQPATNRKASSRETDNGASEREKQLASVAGSALSRLQSGLSQGIGEIGVPGPGGPAYASYNLALRKFYEDAWIPPRAASDNEPLVEVEVTIARDGTVVFSRILKKAGKRELDQSVQRTLDRVKKVPPFPSGSKDEKRTFRINFNLSSKLNLG